MKADVNIKSNLHENIMCIPDEWKKEKKIHVVTLRDPLTEADTTIVGVVHAVPGDHLDHRH